MLKETVTTTFINESAKIYFFSGRRKSILPADGKNRQVWQSHIFAEAS